MVLELKVVLILLGLTAATVVSTQHAYWWQTKEYRLDRLIVWLRYNQGWKELLNFKFRHPVWTQRGICLVVSGVLLPIVLLFTFYKSFWWIIVLFSPLFAVLGVVIGAFLTWPISKIYCRRDTSRAKLLMEKYHPLVVAITGSFGKSSSKEFLSCILSKKYRVLKTIGNENTQLGVARRILSDLRPDTQIAILEMGAYKEGEIKAICQIAQSDIAWVSGISNQHIGLFGNLHNLKKTKFEVVEALRKNGTAFFNGDSPGSATLIKWAKKQGVNTVVYGLTDRFAQVRGKILEPTKDNFEMKVDFYDKKWQIKVPLRGTHFAQNLLGSIAVASSLGISSTQIKQAIQSIRQPEHTLDLHKLKSGAWLVDNSYSINEQGFLASIAYLRLFRGRKFILSAGIIELGEDTEKVHRALAKSLGNIDVFITNKLHGSYLISGGAKVTIEENPYKMFKVIEQTLHIGDTLLIEGRVPSLVYQRILALC